MPGRLHVDDEVRDALVLRRVGVGAGQADAPARELRVRRPHLLTREQPAVVDAHGARLQRREVGAGVGLAEQLAPDLVGGEDRRQPALLLLVGAVREQRRARRG